MTWAVQVFKNGVNILETTKTFTATTVTSYAFTTSNVGYPNDESSDACTDSYSPYQSFPIILDSNGQSQSSIPLCS